MKKNIFIVAIVIAIIILAIYGAPTNQIVVNSFYCTPTIVEEGDVLSISYIIQNPTSSQITVFAILFADYNNVHYWNGFTLDQDSPLTPIQIAPGTYSKTYQWTVDHNYISPDNILRVGLEVQQAYENDVHAFFDVTYIPSITSYNVTIYTNPSQCSVNLASIGNQTSTTYTQFADVPKGTYTLTTSKTGYITDVRSISVNSYTEEHITLILNPYKTCWRCLEGIPKSKPFPSDTICGEGDAEYYPFTSEPECNDIPGFEIVTLLASIGVAYLIYRGRKNGR